VIGSPYSVTISGKSVSPEQAPKQVKEAADKLKRAIANAKGIKIQPSPDYKKKFTGKVNSPAISFADKPLAPIGISSLSSNMQRGSYPTYVIPEVPVTTDPVAETSYGTLADISDVDLRRKLENIIDRQRPPYDFYYASVAATFDLNKWKQNYADLP